MHTREYARIRRIYAADTRANTRGYTVNTQDTYKDTRRIREDTQRMFTVRRRVVAYELGYITHYSVRLGELITSREWQKAPFPRHRARREEEGRQLEEEAVRHFSYLLLLICVGDEGRRLAAECGLDRRHGGRHAARAWRMSSSSSCGWHRPRLRRVRMPLRRAAVEVCARLSCKQTFALTMPAACDSTYLPSL